MPVDFQPSEEQEQLLASVRAVLDRECPPRVAREAAETGKPPAQPWRSAVELGWTAIAVPEALGGLGLGFAELGLVVEEHGRHLAPGPFVATLTQFLPVVREAGGDRWTRAVARGERTGALAARGGECRARRDGDDWILEGSRRFVLDGDTADEIAVVARVEAGDGVGLFAVPREAIESERVVSLDPTRPLAHLSFAGVCVGSERVLGEPGRSAEALRRALDEVEIALALEITGVCARLLELCVEHARGREQFDRPIGSFQAVAHKCVDMLVAVEKTRATAHFAMLAVAEDDPRRSLAAAMAMAAAGDARARVARDAIQIHGGTGFTWESDIHLFARRALTDDLLFGGAAEQRARIADLLL